LTEGVIKDSKRKTSGRACSYRVATSNFSIRADGIAESPALARRRGVVCGVPLMGRVPDIPRSSICVSRAVTVNKILLSSLIDAINCIVKKLVQAIGHPGIT
jgi:hypothetical protein